jgi:hypothetical protein
MHQVAAHAATVNRRPWLILDPQRISELWPPCMQIAWQMSIYLEALAILPQLTLLMRTENIDNLTTNYVALLGAYRGLYLLNWVYRWATEPNYYHWLGALLPIGCEPVRIVLTCCTQPSKCIFAMSAHAHCGSVVLWPDTTEACPLPSQKSLRRPSKDAQHMRHRVM